MSDVRQKAKDLLRLALESPEGQERNAATIQLLRIIDKYDLLSAGGKPINVGADILQKIMAEDFMDGVASRVENFASNLDRVMAAGKRVMGQVGVEPRERGGRQEPRERRRRRR